MSQPVRVGLIDDHPVVREGLRVFLESSPDIDIVFDAGMGDEAIRLLNDKTCDVVVLDLVLREGLGGIATFDLIRSKWPDTTVLILTSYRDPDSLRYLQNHGAKGYLDKTVEPDDLLEAIRMVAKGRTVWDVLPEQTSGHRTIEELTPREVDVLKKMAEGLSNKQIASDLSISEKTVKVHVSHILAKLNVYDRTQAVIAGHQLGLVHLPSGGKL